MTTAGSEGVKACCARLYGSEAVRWVLGDDLHPGGEQLTARLIEGLELPAGGLAVDVACGPGRSSLQVAAATGCHVIGVDLLEETLAGARVRAQERGLAGMASFVQGDAEHLPLGDASADGVLCECALCTFPDKLQALSEIRRVLRPGARLALSDVVARPSELSDDLRSVEAAAACIGDARPLDELVGLIAEAGLVVESVHRCDEALATLADRAHARLRLARALGSRAPEDLRTSVEAALSIAREVRQATARGVLGYAVIMARRPAAI